MSPPPPPPKKKTKRYFQLFTKGSLSASLSLSLSLSLSTNYSPSESSSFTWSHTLASVFAAIIPLAAAAGTPIPGAQLSPTLSSPGRPVFGPGKLEFEAEIPGP